MQEELNSMNKSVRVISDDEVNSKISKAQATMLQTVIDIKIVFILMLCISFVICSGVVTMLSWNLPTGIIISEIIETTKLAILTLSPSVIELFFLYMVAQRLRITGDVAPFKLVECFQ